MQRSRLGKELKISSKSVAKAAFTRATFLRAIF